MIIINAVECKNIGTLQSVVDRYLLDNPTSVLFTDDEKIKMYIDANYGLHRCIFNTSLVAMWFRVEENSIVLLTRIHNICSEVYYDLNNNYPVVCIENSNDYGVENALGVDPAFNPIGVIGGD